MCSFHPKFFSILSFLKKVLNWIGSIFTHHLFYSVLHYDYLVNFSFQVLYFSTPEFPFGSLHHVYLFINIFCLIWNCHHTFPYFFNNISFSSLSIFTTATLKSLLQKHLICLTIFYLQCFFACLAIFCWKLDILGNIL